MAQYLTTKFTRTINGVKYSVYPKTITDQVLTSEGVNLTEVLNNLASSSEVGAVKDTLKTFKNLYRLRGILVDGTGTNSSTAIEKLYDKTDMEIGDIYLVQIGVRDTKRIMEQYVYAGSQYGWVYFGLGTVTVADKLPSTLGEPGQFLVVSDDGNSLEFSSTDVTSMGKSLIVTHNTDPDAHEDIRTDIANMIDVGYDDILSKSKWTLNRDIGKYQYKYTSNNLIPDCYFSINPIVDDNSVAEIIANAEISPSFSINSTENDIYAVITATYIPRADIPIYVKMVPKFNTL